MKKAKEPAAATTSFDPSVTSVDRLIELFPDLGLFGAEDIVAWYEKNGAFPDADVLMNEVGLDADLANRMASAAIRPAAPTPPEVEEAAPVTAPEPPVAPPEREVALMDLPPGEGELALLDAPVPVDSPPDPPPSEPSDPLASEPAKADAASSASDAGSEEAPPSSLVAPAVVSQAPVSNGAGARVASAAPEEAPTSSPYVSESVIAEAVTFDDSPPSSKQRAQTEERPLLDDEDGTWGGEPAGATSVANPAAAKAWEPPPSAPSPAAAVVSAAPAAALPTGMPPIRSTVPTLVGIPTTPPVSIVPAEAAAAAAAARVATPSAAPKLSGAPAAAAAVAARLSGAPAAAAAAAVVARLSGAPAAVKLSAAPASATPAASAAPAVVSPAVLAAKLAEQVGAAEPAPVSAVAQVLAAPKAKSQRRIYALGVAGLLLVNVGVVVGMFRMRAEERRARAPVAAMSAEVAELHTMERDTRAELAGTQAKLEETRTRLDHQASVLATTVENIAATSQRQKEAERIAKEHDAKEARELAALAARVNRVEKRADEGTYKLSEAIKLIDLVQGRTSGGAVEPAVDVTSRPSRATPPEPRRGEGAPRPGDKATERHPTTHR